MRTTAEQAGFLTGVGLIVLGGIVSATARPLHFELGSWLGAYLVLVAGLSQCVMSEQRRLLAPARTIRPRLVLQLGCWNAGNLLVIVGTVGSVAVVGYLGSALLLLALLIAASRTRHAGNRRWAWALRLLYLVLAISVPIGLVLAQVRNG